MDVLGYLIGVLGYLMGVLGYLIGVLGGLLPGVARPSGAGANKVKRGAHPGAQSMSAPLSSHPTARGHGLVPPPGN